MPNVSAMGDYGVILLPGCAVFEQINELKMDHVSISLKPRQGFYEKGSDLAAQQFPYFSVRWLRLDKFESWRYTEQIATPTLVVAAEHDEVIPRSSTEALYKRFRAGVASFKVVAGTSHNTISESPEYIPILRSVAMKWGKPVRIETIPKRREKGAVRVLQHLTGT